MMKTLEEVMKYWEPVIGLEIHTELTTLNTKMFCGCKLAFGDEPNTHTCPVCLGMPGALPTPNKEAIKSIVLAGFATNCDIEKKTLFYRKNYVYPDMAKNFQTTQGPIAFCMRGHLDLDVDKKHTAERYKADELASGDTFENITKTDDGYVARVGITRIHMEEDAGKMVHIGGGEGRIAGATHSLVDYNRAGTPLIELVTEPDLRTPEEARLFMQKLRQIYLAIGISDCSMEQGSFRCDGNISLRKRGTTELGVKTELKNINSFKSLHDGLKYEILRQAQALEDGEQIRQETRHWDPSAKRTIVMRVKETADDYRLFPEPDLAPYDLSDEFIESVRDMLPELPDEKVARYENDYSLSKYDAKLLTNNLTTTSLFESAIGLEENVSADFAKNLANLLINNVSPMIDEEKEASGEETKNIDALTPERLCKLVATTVEGKISKSQQKEVLQAIIDEDKDPDAIIREKGFEQISDSGAIEETIDKILSENPDKVEEYKGGKTGLIGFFVGQCMKEMKGKGNPQLINQILSEKLK